ncbi:efflux RND transporter periplasmic adaptor subunit [Propionicimonas sp.]|uniref:efflux RND transporter periplasmic adaptor subunit n=1 Tax=Propionicimonas sp. TaxID=1955623 RepID=UPI001E137211|nr:biotin/lipoyl-binding protein [Propionicimonas sp.]MBU3977933.1 biotin/lipoyl-binding protein [Actinomycetota bacterium]MBU3985377.1 biotin/lipoyl-binding protein [Actinomycetota bacterium]MBU4007472.1 biotin/lipoyl-binding protein [Actinomycetota bacterium]MBU4066634.1 biotin/lipoyl-binding protein [Actinomycetota bacterium]MBU4091976.1 biotin/lipoyl-binding protein [Actinomycetota bacterium]
MKLTMNPRLRAVLVAAVALSVVAAIGIGVANATTTTSSRWVTATAITGDVTQNYVATGSISRKNTVSAAFAASGTVNKVLVSVGSEVSAGDVLATLDTRSLKLAVLEAETSVARAELSLYNARHPSTSTSTTSSKSTQSKTPTGVTVTFDLAGLNAAGKRVTAAVSGQAAACDPIMAWVNDEVSTTSTTTEASPSASATPSASASTTSSSADPSEAEIKACATARVELTAADSALQAVLAAINKAASAGSSSPSTGGSSSSTKVSAGAVASAKATLLQAEQNLQSAKDDLAEAELLAPISGTIGTVGLSKGDSASAGSVTIVGTGDAVVTIEVPLKTRGSLSIGAVAKVTPAGSLTALDGKVTSINLLETSGTSGSSPTYATTIAVADPEGRLASGAKASVAIPIKAVTGVVSVPVSAVTPTGTGTATVKVLASGATTPTTTTVKTGAVGGGWVEITEGLTAGQVVVLADSTAEIPANATRSRTGSSASSSSSASTKPSSTATSAPQPSASASR